MRFKTETFIMKTSQKTERKDYKNLTRTKAYFKEKKAERYK